MSVSQNKIAVRAMTIQHGDEEVLNAMDITLRRMREDAEYKALRYCYGVLRHRADQKEDGFGKP